MTRSSCGVTSGSCARLLTLSSSAEAEYLWLNRRRFVCVSSGRARHLIHCCVAALFLGVPPAASPAQKPGLQVPLDSGRLVRLHLNTGETIRGRLLESFGFASATLSLCRYPAPRCRSMEEAREIAVSEMEAIEVRIGSRARHGAVLGGSIGAGLAALAGSGINSLCDAPGCEVSILLFTFLGGLQGALWGLLFGSQAVVRGPAP